MIFRQLAILVNKNSPSKQMEKSMSEYVSNTTHCRRDALFRNFDQYKHTFTGPLCMCCNRQVSETYIGLEN